MAKRIVWTEQVKPDVRCRGEGDTKQLQGLTPPMIRLRAGNHRVLFRDHGEYMKSERVLDR